MAAVRQQVTVEASSRVVWNALTTEEGVKRWWADEARIDAREGGRIVLGVPGPVGDDGAPTTAQHRGMFHLVTPTRAVEIAWDAGPWKGSRLQFQVGRGEGETKLHVVHSLVEVEGAEPPDTEGLDRFWKDALRRLRDTLEA